MRSPDSGAAASPEPNVESVGPADSRGGTSATSAMMSRPGLAVIGIGVASAAIYAWAFTFTFPLWRLVGQPQADYAWFGRYTRESQATYLCAFVALFALQYGAYRIVRRRPHAISMDLIVSGQVIFGILNVWIYPVA